MKPVIFIPGDAEKFQNYAQAVERYGGGVRFDGVPERYGGGVRCDGAPEEDCAGLLLPGGGDMEPWRYGQVNTASRNLDPVRDALELELLDRFAALKKPILGICRGMQSVNVFFGGTLLQDIPGHTQIGGADRMHGVRNAPGTFAEFGAERVNSAHHQAVDRLGSGLRVGQWAPDGVIEAICHERFPVWGVQWHPERLNHPAGERLFRAFVELCAASF